VDEERLFAQLKAKDEELQTSESSIEQLANDQRRVSDNKLRDTCHLTKYILSLFVVG
jgi:hypothetical protein